VGIRRLGAALQPLTRDGRAPIVNLVVNHGESAIDRTFAALADPTRRAILARLALGSTTVGELARPFEMSLPAITKHLGVLERAGLLRRERLGRIKRCQLVPGPMKEASDWIEQYRQFWEDRFDQLARFLEEQKRRPKGRDSNGRRTGSRGRRS